MRGSYEVQFKENFAGTSMAVYLERMSDKMKRGAIRGMMSKSGTVLAREIRAQLKRENMPYSRARNADERRKARKSGSRPLQNTIKTRAWSRPRKGLIGVVVGPSYPAGAHGHLVEFGHKITGRSRVKLKLFGKLRRIGRRRVARHGNMTVAHPFQQRAQVEVRGDLMGVQERALAAFIRKQGTRAL